MNAPQKPITISVGAESVVCQTVAATLDVVRRLAEPIRPRERDLLAVRLKLGAALVQVRRQIPHGSWENYLDRASKEHGLNRHTLRNACTLADRLAGPTGELDESKKAALLASKRPAEELRAALDADPSPSNLHGRVDLTPPQSERNANPNLHHGVDLTLRQAEILAGVRSPSRRAIAPDDAAYGAPANAPATSGPKKPTDDPEDDPGLDVDDDEAEYERENAPPGSEEEWEDDDDFEAEENDHDEPDDVAMEHGGSDRVAGLRAGGDLPARVVHVAGRDRDGADAGRDRADARADEHGVGDGRWRSGPQGLLFDELRTGVVEALGRCRAASLRGRTADPVLAGRVHAATQRYLAELDEIVSGAGAGASSATVVAVGDGGS